MRVKFYVIPAVIAGAAWAAACGKPAEKAESPPSAPEPALAAPPRAAPPAPDRPAEAGSKAPAPRPRAPRTFEVADAPRVEIEPDKMVARYGFIRNFESATYREIEGVRKIRLLPLSVEGKPRRQAIFAHAPATVTYTGISIPRGAALTFTPSIHPNQWEHTDGATFAVFVTGPDGRRQRIYFRELAPRENPGDRVVEPEALSLAAFGGRTVTLEFETGNAEGKVSGRDWTLWVDPKVQVQKR